MLRSKNHITKFALCMMGLSFDCTRMTTKTYAIDPHSGKHTLIKIKKNKKNIPRPKFDINNIEETTEVFTQVFDFKSKDELKDLMKRVNIRDPEIIDKLEQGRIKILQIYDKSNYQCPTCRHRIPIGYYIDLHSINKVCKFGTYSIKSPLICAKDDRNESFDMFKSKSIAGLLTVSRSMSPQQNDLALLDHYFKELLHTIEKYTSKETALALTKSIFDSEKYMHSDYAALINNEKQLGKLVKNADFPDLENFNLMVRWEIEKHDKKELRDWLKHSVLEKDKEVKEKRERV